MASLLPASMVLLLHLYALETSRVRLEDHGYENVLLAISPLVPENQAIITNAKEMVTEASFYLFNATKRRFYFRNVKILVPANWKPNNYQARKYEAYVKADIIVAEAFSKYHDDPYTLQYGRCGEPGRYIHLTPNFLLQDSLLPVYGPRGRVLVHEWAHLRWGVFDEYSLEEPFYKSGQRQMKATRCSLDLTGAIVCDGSSCVEGNCKTSTQEKLLKKGCTFLADKSQNASASIMYMQALASVVDFCNESTHNREVPHMQNKMCDYRSTWDVIMASGDYQATPPMDGTHPPPPPSFSLLQVTQRVICLVLDFSASMNLGNRVYRVRQAVEIFLLQIVETGVLVGIVTFAGEAEVRAPLTLVTSEDVRRLLASHLLTRAKGGSHVCKGLLTAFQVIQGQNGNNTHGSEIVLLAAGEDNTVPSCFSDVVVSGAIIHTIALGPRAAKDLKQLSDMTGGFVFSATDRPGSSALIDAFTGISPANGNLFQQSIQLESVADVIAPDRQLSGTVTIDLTVGNDTYFVLTWLPTNEPLAILLEDPHENTYTSEDFVTDLSFNIARLQIPGSAAAGNWTYKISNTLSSNQAISMTVTSRAATNGVPPVTVKVHTSKDRLRFPEPMIVYAEVTQGFLPILEARVMAIIECEFGNTSILELLDDGAGADAVKNDGVYSKYFFSATGNGRHNVKVCVQGKSNAPISSNPPNWSRAMYVPGYIESGKIQMNPPRPLFGEEYASVGGFSRTATGGTFLVSEVPQNLQTDVFPPCPILDLRVETDDENVYLSWTAPGDDYDESQASNYEIKMSDSPLKLRHHFENAMALNTSTLRPQPAGSRETAVFKTRDLAIVNSTTVYFAVQAIDDTSLRSNISNVVLAIIWVQAPVTRESVARQNISTEVFVVIGSITAICFVISVIIYTLKKLIFRKSTENRNLQKTDVSQELEVVFLE